jgi:hypothetical protein
MKQSFGSISSQLDVQWTYQLGEEVAYASVWNISGKCIEREGPRHRIGQCFLQLIHLEMFVPNSLSITPHSRDRQDSVPGREPSCVELVVWDDIPKDETEHSGKTTIDEKDDLPWGKGCTIGVDTAINTVRNKSSKYLTEAMNLSVNTSNIARALVYPLNENHSPVRVPCSDFVHHCEVKSANPGVTALSNTPRKNLTATALPKLHTVA